jgi:DNA repair exonuclease SbcCD ATPase subunit
VLKDWRSYEDVTVEFGAGTTFVVASNGVGKTSLVEAARWALFGSMAPGGDAAIRAGAASALVVVDLELPDLRVLTVERTLARKSRNSGQPPVVRLDGAPVLPEQLERHLVAAYGAERSFLAGLTMPAVDRDHDKPSSLGLEEHLGRYFGIDGLKKAIDELKVLRRVNDARIKGIKEVNSASSRRLAELQSDLERASLRAEEADRNYKAVRDRMEKAHVRERQDAAVQNWRQDYATWTETTSQLAARLSVDYGRPVSVDGLDAVLDEMLADLDQRVEAVRVQVAVNSVRETALVANDERLDAAHDDCPVCRRPLDDTTITSAHELNSRELDDIRSSTRELKVVEVDLLARRKRVIAVRSEWRQIPKPGESPQTLAGEDDESAPFSELATMAEISLNALVDSRAVHIRAKEALDEARSADKAMRELESLFGKEARLRVVIETAESTLTELLNDTIRPLAKEVDERWRILFPGRGGLNTHSSGDVTRMVNGQSLPYDSFSTGEGMGLTILLRLIVAQMVTKAGFCWFDEPLEHLDPDVRRQVASILSRVTHGEGFLKQVVVTTYEEPLARHLHARDEQGVRLLDMRQAS